MPRQKGSIGKPAKHSTVAREIIKVARLLYERGWALGTSGNFSAVLSREPLRLAITASGLDKGSLKRRDILQVDAAGEVLKGRGRPSDETRLHLTVVRVRGADAVLHTHSVYSTLLSEEHAADGGLSIQGFEMLKGLSGVRTHEHQEWLPVVDNSQDMTVLSASLEAALRSNPEAHGVLLRGHGLYTWGKDLAEAKRHVEILEFLMEVVARRAGKIF